MQSNAFAFSILALAWSFPISGQSVVPEAVSRDVEASVRSALLAEQAAFAAGDCPVAMDYLADWRPLFVVGGQTMNRPQVVQMCSRMVGPRPGPPRELVSHVINVLSESSAISVTHYRIQRPQDDGTRAEGAQMVTKVWVQTDQEWKIVHLHESIGRPPRNR